MTVILHQFPISHYCEKVRWALDYKGVRYRVKNHLPGLHLKKVSRLAGASSVPVIQNGKDVVQGSAAIISYLDRHFPDRPLTPADEAVAAQAIRWEAYCDEQVGPHVRRYCYHTLLDYPDLVIPFFAQGGPLWGKPFLKAIYPKLQGVMRKAMQIREPQVSESRQALEDAIATLAREYESRPYLAGDGFSRADLAAASLLAPLLMPPEYGLDWPQSMPEPLQGWVDQQVPLLARYADFYRTYR
ncbi:glutathione S-transferase family protein [Alcanivorax sp. DP30]|uniref:glutathione S-transferase family protein n=1 Tax=Alcanivorax sp. DP30 TaxID=2606217 RepID=UPI0013707327|nr:glutathione S-transferase family protein [Alcanivorax sp. DP30]MZR63757.1 glutathione S-transferase family protein [Alcanivorax sp. DP30]